MVGKRRRSDKIGTKCMAAPQNVEAKEERRMNRGHAGAEPSMYGELAPNGVTQMKCASANKSIRIIRRTPQKPQKPTKKPINLSL